MNCHMAPDMLCQEMQTCLVAGLLLRRHCVTARKLSSHRGRSVTMKEKECVFDPHVSRHMRAKLRRLSHRVVMQWQSSDMASSREADYCKEAFRTSNVSPRRNPSHYNTRCCQRRAASLNLLARVHGICLFFGPSLHIPSGPKLLQSIIPDWGTKLKNYLQNASRFDS